MGITGIESFKGDLKITGQSSAPGGRYERVKIMGDGVVNGDVDCSRLKCIGTLVLNGSLSSEHISMIGTGSFSGDVQAGQVKLTGTAAIGGDARLNVLRGSGSVETKGSLRGEQFRITGQIQTQGDCAADVFNLRGMFEIGGLLNAGEIDIRLYQDCWVQEIGGEHISIRKASLRNPLQYFYFRPQPHACLTVNVIEGDDIYIEHTKAAVVRGNRITVGPGCEIGLVEYKESFEKKKSARVSEYRKL
ncbi:hypothetical protein GCM10010918_22170 [Paenibacillus radicis (ex Gao et al. 2016)]|uniref:Polymer-forming cytoskeletal protein n=2 Tax=Paenibacillus radicis (ex Gao et al. 2016) TaxID=1737354 RepID=A0A917LZC1_9BACL|nr:hypothetical protein GCM10010918_22170 [Paenibacillus radicis (ex Gao et al. 2016)]